VPATHVEGVEAVARSPARIQRRGGCCDFDTGNSYATVELLVLDLGSCLQTTSSPDDSATELKRSQLARQIAMRTGLLWLTREQNLPERVTIISRTVHRWWATTDPSWNFTSVKR
jgi:hypothetical protein